MPTKKATKKTPAKRATAKKRVAKKPAQKAAKKTARRTTPKKTAKKAAAKKTKKSLVLADNQRSFWVANGQILNSLVALRDALAEMEKEVYSYHAGGAHNDFAIWVDTVLSDDQCARDLKKAKTPRSAKTVVVRHLKLYAV